MAAEIVPLRRPKTTPPPTRTELVARVRKMAVDSPDDLGFDNPHLKERMQQRGITMRQVLETLRKGEGVSGPIKDEYGDWRIKLKRLVAGRRVQVVVALSETEIAVVTAI